MFNKILIANRGEIAYRIIRTARRLGVLTVSVYSQIDEQALHVKQSDQSWALGGNTAKESYLDMDKIIEAAKSTGVEAIHPGYGFLSENAQFAQRCENEGIRFIGPSARSIELMGAKNIARQIMSKAGVPVLPGYDGEDQQQAHLLEQAKNIGYPLLIKATAGGGGKGMRIVHGTEDFIDNLQAVKRESLASFADDKVILEKYLSESRHIEVQIFADSDGHTVHLFERDCSMQRRHQKIIEESPAPGIDEAVRRAMTDAALKCAQAIEYLGAGTVEFLYTPEQEFYFMEMNTRLQVEHPVTEMVTGQDLVEWQLMVAAGLPLPVEQDQIQIAGHAIEARIYAENPRQHFLPATGQIQYLQQPDENQNVRIESGVESGDVISPYYDPMIAKLIVHGADRDTALVAMEQALDDYVILGLHNNVSFIKNLIISPVFSAARLNTSFIDQQVEQLIGQEFELQPILTAAAVWLYQHRKQCQQYNNQDRHIPSSIWYRDLTLRSKMISYSNMDLELNGVNHRIGVTRFDHHYFIQGQDNPVAVATPDVNSLIIKTGHQERAFKLALNADQLFMHHQGLCHHIKFSDPTDPMVQTDIADSTEGSLSSPMPGTVVAVHVEPGQNVETGDTMMVVEAMKMEHKINAPYSGTVKSILFNSGDQVDEGASLMVIEQ